MNDIGETNNGRAASAGGTSDLLIAQITDLHLGFDRTIGTGPNVLRLRKVIKALNRLRRRPDLLLVTGDLVESGEHWAYALLKGEMRRAQFPVHYGLGNHDSRDVFASVFEDVRFTDGYLQYAVEDHPLRIVMIDSMEPGRHGGAFCEDRARWLDDTLSARPDTPTLLALHHPPIRTGIGWMTASDDSPWVERLRGVIARHPQVRHIIAGHIHCHIQKTFAGVPISVSRAVAPSVKLELDPIDPATPDGRAMIVDDSPGYSLHWWDGQSVTTYSQTASDGRTLVSYTEDYAFIPAMTMDLEDGQAKVEPDSL